MREHAVKATLLALLLAAGGHAARAGVVTFTWDPSKALPALAGAPAAFTADSVVATNFNRTVNVNDPIALRQTVTSDQYQTVTGLTLGGSPVAAPGLNSTYGLYFHITSVFSFPISPGGTVIGPATISSLNLSLIADVGHDDGTLSTGASGVGFGNAAGVANDVTLATGSLISGSFSVNPDGSRHNNIATTFIPAVGEGGFFAAPGGAPTLVGSGDSALAAFTVVPIDGQSFLTLVNGNQGSGVTIQFVPEPMSFGVLAAGLPGLWFARRRRMRQG